MKIIFEELPWDYGAVDMDNVIHIATNYGYVSMVLTLPHEMLHCIFDFMPSTFHVGLDVIVACIGSFLYRDRGFRDVIWTLHDSIKCYKESK